MTDDFIRYGTTGGIYAAYPDEIASIFVEYYMRQGGSKLIILLNSLKNGIEQQERALEFIKQYIDFFRQWAYRRADGDKELLQEIDNYIKGLYEWLKQGKEKGQLDDIEHQRLKAQKESLTEKLYDHIPERLISGGQTSIEQLLNDIQNYEYAIDYPPTPSFKWQNGEIERLGLISERIKLLMRLIKKIYSECAAKYHYLHHLQEIVFDIASYTGVLELSRDKYDWKIVDNNIEEYKRWFNIHLSNIKELRQELREADKTEQKRLQEIISSLKRYKESGDKSALPPIRSLSDLLYKYKYQCTEKSVDVIIQLRRAVRSDAGYYSELLNILSSDEFLEDLEKVKSYVSARTEQGEKKKRGRPTKYSDKTRKLMIKAHSQFYKETQDSKAAWNKVAALYGAKNGESARKACANYKKKLEKST